MMPYRRVLLCGFAAALAAGAAVAEKADKEKATHIEAGRMSADDARRLSIFEGDVVFSKGTMSVRAQRIVIRQDADGFQYATATGSPVHFRQKTDPKNGQPGVWIEGEALRVEIDGRNEKVEMHEQARVTRDQDILSGDYILYDQRTEFLNVSGAKNAAEPGRVQIVIQPPAASGKTPEPEPQPEPK
ncbi:MAG: lipopolysaccharide transport periplasmic protein LptA [Betaproteobacteria bacterium]|nr:lipopolysaccharide transport periplasmic protein LptA [Betaproteobacteria bacterium]